MYLVVLQRHRRADDGISHNTAFLLGRDGKEIGRYHKVNLPLPEQGRTRGDRFPVFPTPDLGGVGHADLLRHGLPRGGRGAWRSAGADIIFHPTLGGAAIGDDDISLAAFRTRAVENFVYLVVVAARQRQHDHLARRARSSPQGEGRRRPGHRRHRPVRRPRGRRRLQHAAGHARPALPRAGPGRLRHPHRSRTRPCWRRCPSNVTREDAIRIAEQALTIGEERFSEAEALPRAGKTEEAIRAFEKLRAECRDLLDRPRRARAAGHAARPTRAKSRPSGSLGPPPTGSFACVHQRSPAFTSVHVRSPDPTPKTAVTANASVPPPKPRGRRRPRHSATTARY